MPILSKISEPGGLECVCLNGKVLPVVRDATDSKLFLELTMPRNKCLDENVVQETTDKIRKLE